MFSQTLNGKVGLAASLATISLLSVGVLAPAAHAFSLVPTMEGEVALDNLACLTDSCFSLDSSIFAEVTSDVDSSTGTQSYLFVDQEGTDNTYNDLVNGGTFTFKAVDSGTAELSQKYWFRPVAVNSDGSLIEKGELEVGTFTFKFASVLSELNLSFFDTEKENTTSFDVLYADSSSETITVAAGGNANIQDFNLSNVSQITLNLGDRYGRTGDGVNFKGTAEAVPEPSMMLGAAVVAAGGAVLRKRRRQA